MARTGRPKDPELRGKTETILARVSPETRDKLEAAAQESGWSLSREIETRLAASLTLPGDDQKWGGQDTYAFCRAIARLIRVERYVTQECWLQDRFTFDRIAKDIERLLHRLRPPGNPKVPPNIVHLRTSALKGKALAELRRQLLRGSYEGEEADQFLFDLKEYAGPFGQQREKLIRENALNPRQAIEMGHLAEMKGIGDRLLPKIDRTPRAKWEQQKRIAK